MKKNKKYLSLLILLMMLVAPINVLGLSSSDTYQLRAFSDFSYAGGTHDTFNLQSLSDSDDIYSGVFCIDPGVEAYREVDYTCNVNYSNKSVLCGIAKVTYENKGLETNINEPYGNWTYLGSAPTDPNDYKLNLAKIIIDCVNSGDCHTKWCNGGTTYGDTGNNEEGTLTIGDVSDKLTLSSDKKYYVSKEIPISYTGTIENYKITLANAPAGTLVTTSVESTTGINLDEIQDSKVLYVKIPVESSASSIKLTLKVSASSEYSYRYATATATQCNPETSGYQRIIVADPRVFEGKGNLKETDETTFSLSVGDLVVTKKDADNGEVLKGVEFNLYNTTNGECNLNSIAKTVFGNEVKTLTTDQDGKIYVNDLFHGTYCLVEAKSLNNYAIVTTPTKVTIDQDVENVEIVNKQIRFKISKKAITGEDELPGAIIKIETIDGVWYKEFESTTEPMEFVIDKGTYILTETIAPQGYLPVENSLKFSVDDEGRITILSEANNLYELNNNHLTIRNDLSKIYISKKNITNVEELPGATIKITCENGYEKEFVSGNEETILEALPLVGGTCTLTETIAPEGYDKIKSSLVFKIDEKGDIKVTGKASDYYYVDGNRVIIYNGTFPDTGIYTWIGITIIGAGLITGGSIIIIRELKKKKINTKNK